MSLPVRHRPDRSAKGGAERSRVRGVDPGTVALLVVAVVVLLVLLPVVVKGAPLADDYYSCVRHDEIGLGGALRQSLAGTGAVRPARFLEILLIASLCGRVPFGLVMLVPLALTFAVALLLRGLLRDLGLSRPWPEIGAALWLLAPLGAESALWPSALHVPLGIAAALASLRMYRRERAVLGTLLALAAFLSLEQSIFVLPAAAFLVAGRDRRTAVLGSGSAALVVLICFAVWPGDNVRTAVSLSDRLTGPFRDLIWYVKFPVAGLGVYSIPLAVVWAFPLGLVVLVLGGWLGDRLGRAVRRTADEARRHRAVWGPIAALALLVILVNVPEMTTVPRGVSGRIFAPTWLLLSAGVAVVADRLGAPRPRWVWAGAGALVAGAVLSLAFAVDVRLQTADFTQASSDYIAARLTAPNEVVEVCGVRRTVVSPAPIGSFAIHEFVYDWSAAYALKFYTGHDATFVLRGPLWGTSCTNLARVDDVFRFQQLRAVAGLGG